MSDAPTQIAANEKHACPACGAQAEWNPGKQKLICPFCGTESPYEIHKESGTVQEIDLVTALREMPEELRGWNTDRRSVQCQSCKAVMVFDPAKVGQNCEFCGSPALVDYAELKSPIRPQSLLPFTFTQDQIRDGIRHWYASKWFAPNALRKKALVDQIKGLYIPYWTFDAQVHCPWDAEAGYYYYETESYTDNQGKSQTRQVRRVRWEPASGVVDHFFDDEPVPATKGIKEALLRGVEPFPTKDLVPYDTAFLSGFVVEHYQVVLVDAAKKSRDQMNDHLVTMCGGQVPGDTQRNLEIHPDFSGLTFKHILVPVWLVTYLYATKVYQVVANGSTGVIAGQYPKSFWKIAFVVTIALIVLTLIVLANS
ncbi:MAG: zinc ribbon domain-containing protein [Acidobacteriota bacterium]